VKQTKIITCERQLTALERHNIKRKLAGAVYRDNLPFNVYAPKKALYKVIRAIHSQVKLPNRN
jgi:hypothetical protein